jgi:outer membrane receptor protein involved in Fe transport
MQNPLLGAMFLANAGDATEFGYEVEVDAAPPLPPGWGSVEVNAIVGHQQGKFKNVPAALSTAVANGNKLARIRPLETQGTITYRHAAWGDWRWLGVLSYNSENGGFEEASNVLFLGSYTVWNARVALQNDRWTLAVRAQNLVDHDYYRNQAGSPVNGIGATYVPGRLRYVEGSLTYRW